MLFFPKLRLKKKSQMSTFILKREREAGGDMPRERNHTEENRKETIHERVQFLWGPFNFPFTCFSGL